MANLKVKLEGKKIAEKVMEFMDNYSFGPVYEGIKEDGDGHLYQRDTVLLPYKKNNKRFGRTRRTP